jgi:hypothetical protein
MSYSQRSKPSSKSSKSKKSTRSKASKASHNFRDQAPLNPELESHDISDADLDILLHSHVKKAKAENKRLSNSMMKS